MLSLFKIPLIRTSFNSGRRILQVRSHLVTPSQIRENSSMASHQGPKRPVGKKFVVACDGGFASTISIEIW
jgi:hypothetical protein